MPTRTEQEDKTRRSNENIAREDRLQNKRNAQLNAVTNLAGGVLGALSKLGGAAVTKGALPGRAPVIIKTDFPTSRFGDNDSSWYKTIPGLTTPNTMIPDFQILGQKDELVRPGFAGVPVIYKFNYAPTIGQTAYDISAGKVTAQSLASDPFNRSLNRVATQLENRNSRVLTYTRDTIGRYIFIVSDIAQDLIRLRIAIEWYTVSIGDKPFLGRQMIRALGFDYDDFRQNIDDYKSAYVSIANDFNQGLPIPKDLSYLQRKDYISRLVAADTSGEYSSLMILNKAVDYHFIENNAGISPDNYVSKMQPVSGYKFTTYIDSLRHRIFLIINGATWKPLIRDLRGSTKSDMWYKLPDTVDGVFSIITSSTEIRNQLHNMDMQPCIPLPAAAKSLLDSGLVCESFSIGGDTTEAVRQGYQYGISSTAIGTGSEFSSFYLASMPGVILMKVSNATEAASVVAQFKEMYGVQAKLGETVSANVIYNQYDKYTADSVIVGTRLKAIWAAREVSVGTSHIVYTVTMDKGAHLQSTFSVAANTDASIVAVHPMTFGTELMLNVGVLLDVEDNAQINPQSTALFVGYTGYSVIHDSNNKVTRVDFSNYMLTRFSAYDAQSNVFPSCSVLHTSLMNILDWAPIIHVYNSVDYALDTSLKGWSILSELDHYTSLDIQALKRLHDQAVESETNIPESNYLKPLQ